MDHIPGVKNQSIRGLTTARLLKMLTEEKCQISLNFKNILLYIGGKDCTTHPRKRTPPADYEDIIKNIECISKLIKAKNPDTNIHFYELAPRLSQYEQHLQCHHKIQPALQTAMLQEDYKGRTSHDQTKPQKDNHAPDGIHLSKQALSKLRSITINSQMNSK